jgi:hypothetical protein
LHGRHAGVSDDAAYGRGGASPLARGLPSADLVVRVDLKELVAAFRPNLEMGLALLARVAPRVLARGGLDPAGAGRVEAFARALVDSGESCELSASVRGARVDLKVEYVARVGTSLAEAGPSGGLGGAVELLPARLPFVYAGPLDPMLVPQRLPPPWPLLLGALEGGGAVAADLDDVEPRWCAALKPREGLRAALEAAGASVVEREGHLVASRGVEPRADGPMAFPEDTVAWARLDLAAAARFLGAAAGPEGRVEVRLSRNGRSWGVEAAVDLQ